MSSVPFPGVSKWFGSLWSELVGVERVAGCLSTGGNGGGAKWQDGGNFLPTSPLLPHPWGIFLLGLWGACVCMLQPAPKQTMFDLAKQSRGNFLKSVTSFRSLHILSEGVFALNYVSIKAKSNALQTPLTNVSPESSFSPSFSECSSIFFLIPF